jgi:hypothetical protein
VVVVAECKEQKYVPNKLFLVYYYFTSYTKKNMIFDKDAQMKLP